MHLLSDDDLETLIDALQVWESKGAMGEMMGDLFGAILMKDSSPEKAKYETERQTARDKAKRETAVRKERSIILQAKILSIRNDRRIGRIESAVSAGAVDPAVGSDIGLTTRV